MVNHRNVNPVYNCINCVGRVSNPPVRMANLHQAIKKESKMSKAPSVLNPPFSKGG